MMTGWDTRRPLELDHVSLWISDIDGRTFTFRAVALFDGPSIVAMRCKLLTYGRFVKRLHTQAEMVQVPSLLTRRSTTGLPELAADGHQVDERTSCAQLDQANFILAPLNRATERVAVEVQYRFQVDDAQNEMVDVEEAEHDGCLWGRLTFDTSGRQRHRQRGRSAQVLPAVGCPLDGGVRRHRDSVARGPR